MKSILLFAIAFSQSALASVDGIATPSQNCNSQLQRTETDTRAIKKIANAITGWNSLRQSAITQEVRELSRTPQIQRQGGTHPVQSEKGDMLLLASGVAPLGVRTFPELILNNDRVRISARLDAPPSSLVGTIDTRTLQVYPSGLTISVKIESAAASLPGLSFNETLNRFENAVELLETKLGWHGIRLERRRDREPAILHELRIISTSLSRTEIVALLQNTADEVDIKLRAN